MLAACPGDDNECATTADCFDKGLFGSCLDGACTKLCERDVECQGAQLMCESGDTACEAENAALERSTFICEGLRCVAGCPDVACGAGETCRDGRCSFYFQGFEAEKSGDRVTLESIGFNRIARELRNNRAKVVWTGVEGCGPETERDLCAGPAADGEYFLALERAPTADRGTLTFGTTCRPCACCRECRDPTARPTLTSSISVCPGVTYPLVDMCEEAVPTACQAVCNACASCVDELASTVFGQLTMCELPAANKACTACNTHNQCLRDREAEGRACPGAPGAYPACATPPTNRQECDTCLVAECDMFKGSCFQCRDAFDVRAARPDEPEVWMPMIAACEGQGDDGCYRVPKSEMRSGLTDDEQSIESPEIDLSGATGRLVLQFEYTPFDVGKTYTRTIQNQPSSTWPIDPQEVAVQFCPTTCEVSASWVDGAFLDDSPAKFPDESQRRNGLQFSLQNAADWTVNLREVEIPAALRTSTFRFRFVPRLDTNVRVGIDRVQIRRRP